MLLPRCDAATWPYTIERLQALARSNEQLLLTGDTGTGKELLAKYLHDHSIAENGPFITVNCSMFTPERMQGDLFGWVRGAFSGAIADSAGPIADADGGTVFLDEIGNLDKSLQGHLLRFLQSKEYQPLGGKMKHGNVRVIAATSKPDAIMEDLRHRFMEQIRLPKLSARGDDVIRLLNLPGFLKTSRFTGITLQTLCKIINTPWQGNMREFSHYCWQKSIKGPEIHPADPQPHDILDDSMPKTEHDHWAAFLSFTLCHLENAWRRNPQAFHDDAHIANTVRLLLTLDDYDDPFALNLVTFPALRKMLANETRNTYTIYDFKYLDTVLCEADDRLEQDKARKGGDQALPGALVLIRNYVNMFADIRHALPNKGLTPYSVSEEFENAINSLVRMPSPKTAPAEVEGFSRALITQSSNSPNPSFSAESVKVSSDRSRIYGEDIVSQVLAHSCNGLSSKEIQTQLGFKSAAQVRGIIRTHAPKDMPRSRSKGGRPRKT